MRIEFDVVVDIDEDLDESLTKVATEDVEDAVHDVVKGEIVDLYGAAPGFVTLHVNSDLEDDA